MLTLTATLSAYSGSDPTTTLAVWSNIDSVGMASGNLKDAPDVEGVPMFPGAPTATRIQYLRGRAFDGPFLAYDLSESIGSVSVGPVCFGAVKVAIEARDTIGNAQSGALAETTETVNSTPLPAKNFRRTDDSAGLPVFTFDQSPQLR